MLSAVYIPSRITREREGGRDKRGEREINHRVRDSTRWECLGPSRRILHPHVYLRTEEKILLQLYACFNTLTRVQRASAKRTKDEIYVHTYLSLLLWKFCRDPLDSGDTTRKGTLQHQLRWSLGSISRNWDAIIKWPGRSRRFYTVRFEEKRSEYSLLGVNAVYQWNT